MAKVHTENIFVLIYNKRVIGRFISLSEAYWASMREGRGLIYVRDRHGLYHRHVLQHTLFDEDPL